MSYLQDYLFSPERVNAPVKSLSGGEKNRLMLAKLMLKPSNVLILDEPTNDLDVETLEMLETLLLNYAGTVILVSHDREFVDNVVNSSLLFTDNGVIQEFVGGYTDIEQWYSEQGKTIYLSGTSKTVKNETKSENNSPIAKQPAKKPKKLSYKDQRELETLPATIESLEEQVEQRQERVNDPDFFKQDSETTTALLNELAALEEKLSHAYARWDELESLLDSTQQ